MNSFFSCDWGTSTFRLRLVRWEVEEEVVILDEFSSACGVRTFSESGPEGFEAYLREALAEMNAPTVPVLISGMASSSVGWKELPYAIVPFAVNEPSALQPECFHLDYRGDQVPVYLFSGVRTANDVMRGEETELIGILTLPPLRQLDTKSALVIMPGTHSKHVQIENGSIVDFTTFMTGEVFELLARQSILRATVDWDSLSGADATLDEAFIEGVRAARDHGVASSLFKVRTAGVLGGKSNASNIRYLLGLMIGDELRTLPGEDSCVTVVLAAGIAFSRSYRLALEVLGFSGRQLICLTPEQLSNSAVQAHASWARSCCP